MSILRRPLALSLVLLAAAACGDTGAPKPTPDTATAAATGTATAAETAQASATTTAEPTSTEAATTATPSSSAEVAKTGAPSTTGAPGTTASATASAKPDVEGEQKKMPSFTAYLAAKPSYKKGQPGTVTAIVNALGEYHVNQEYPYKFKMGTAPAGVTYPEAIVRAVNRTEKKATISIPFTPSAAGNTTISGELSLSVCTDSNCVIEKAQLSVTAKVED
ncbi:MAG: hypothetical protein HOV80_17460 [Polyangiaceae bacterium]|nr:hypothetical protein [Polyangiaceae bacterium]